MRFVATEGAAFMQLSTTSLPVDPQIPVPLLPGLPPGSGVTTASGECPAAFSELLPAPTTDGAVPAKKSPDAAAPAAAEAAASILTGWLASVAPSGPAPTEATWKLTGTTPSANAADESASDAVAGEGELPAQGDAAAPAQGRGRWSTGEVPVFAGRNRTPDSLPTTPAGVPFCHSRSSFNLPSNASAGTAPATASDPVPAAAAAVSPATQATALPAGAEMNPGVPVATVTPEVNAAAATAIPAPAAAETAASAPVAPAPKAETVEAATEIAVTAPGQEPAGTATASRSAKVSRRPERMAAERGAKFAEMNKNFMPAAVSKETASDKKILNTDKEIVTKDDSGLGIGIAMTEAAMTKSSSTTPQSASLPAQAVVSVSVGQTAPTAAQSTAPADPVSQAQHAVAAVLNAAERTGHGSQSTVHLKFSLGDADLSVRVQLRAGEIHATFRTDSAELRSALAAEWQAVSSDTSRTLRLADAVFTPGSSGNAPGHAGDDAAAQRDPSGRRAQEFNDLPGSRLVPSRASTAPAAPEARAAATRSNLNLYTFA